MKKNKSKMFLVTLIMILIILVIGMVCMYSVTFAEENPWTQKADMPDGRHSFAASVVNDRIYAIGGRYTDNLVTEYDPITDTWTTKTPMPTSRMLPVSGVVNGKIYVIGGLVTAFAPALSTVEEYDPAADTWTVKDDMLTQRLGHGVSVVDGKIYVMGGMVSGSNFWSGIQNSVEVYDPLTDTWSTISDIPTPRVWLSTSVVDGKIYAIGGLLVTKEVLSIVEVYDPATDTWATKTPMPTARGGHAATVVDGIIYVIGGGTENGQPVGGYSVVEAYDPATDTWTSKTDLPEPRASLSASVIDGNIYAIGGIPTFANPHLHGEKTVYVYDPLNDMTNVQNSFKGHNYPTQYRLDQNYPNPFNPITIIRFSLPVQDRATIKVYDSLGKEIQTLVNEQLEAGSHSVTFDGTHFSSGVYFYELQAGDIIKTRKMMLIK